MERSWKRSRSATKPVSKAGKRKHRSKSAAVGKLNRQVAKLAAARTLANATTSGFLGIEKKFLDTRLSSTAINSSGALASGMYDPDSGCTGALSVPAQGDSEQNREGKRYVIDSLILKGYLLNPGSATSAIEASAKVFLAVVLDTQTNGAQMTAATCFKNLLGTAAGAADPMKNLLSGKRFRILKSQVYDLTPSGAFAASANFASNEVRRDFDWYIPFKGGLPVNLNATNVNADVANVVDNSLHVVAFSTLNGCDIAYNARIRFQG